MAKIQPYVVVDIETTGVDTERAQALQVAAVIDDGISPLEHLPTFTTLVAHKSIAYGEPIALHMNAGIFERLGRGEGLTPGQAAELLRGFMKRAADSRGRVSVGGKNAAGFDVPILRANGFDTSFFKHRVVDPGAMWFPHFGYVPSLGEINAVLGRKPVSHDALEDCFDVVAAVREAARRFGG